MWKAKREEREDRAAKLIERKYYQFLDKQILNELKYDKHIRNRLADIYRRLAAWTIIKYWRKNHDCFYKEKKRIQRRKLKLQYENPGYTTFAYNVRTGVFY